MSVTSQKPLVLSLSKHGLAKLHFDRLSANGSLCINAGGVSK
jgi:hypothetical protein